MGHRLSKTASHSTSPGQPEPLSDAAAAVPMAGREALLGAPHMRGLEAYRAALLPRWPRMPHFDPLDGGAGARMLVLLESPAPGADELRFVSRDNAAGTGRNLRRFLATAGIAREHTVLWNAVPGILHAPGARNRAPRAAEVAAGLRELPALLDHLPRLRLVLLAGRVAARAAPLLSSTRPALAMLTMPHPSPVYVNTNPAIAAGMLEVLRRAQTLLAADGAGE